MNDPILSIAGRLAFVICLFLWPIAFAPGSHAQVAQSGPEACSYIVDQKGTSQKLHPIQAKNRAYNEAWLQEVLRTNPDILPVANIDLAYWPLTPIGREVNVSTGRIDNLFISRKGYLILIETKLWRNPEAKREVVAQAIDYGSALSKWTFGELDAVARAYTKKYEGTELGLADWVENQLGRMDGGRSLFKDTVEKNLRQGHFLTIVVSDKIRPPVIEMVEYVNNFPNMAMDFALIELQSYWMEKEGEWRVLLVPHIAARTKVIERTIVQVASPKGAKTRILSEREFWELLESGFPGRYEKAKSLIKDYEERDNVKIVTARRSLQVKLRFKIKGVNRLITLFSLNIKGECWVRPRNIGGPLSLAGVDSAIVKDYADKMRDVLKMPAERVDFSYPVDEVDLAVFNSAVDAFLKKFNTKSER